MGSGGNSLNSLILPQKHSVHATTLSFKKTKLKTKEVDQFGEMECLHESMSNIVLLKEEISKESRNLVNERKINQKLS